MSPLGTNSPGSQSSLVSYRSVDIPRSEEHTDVSPCPPTGDRTHGHGSIDITQFTGRGQSQSLENLPSENPPDQEKQKRESSPHPDHASQSNSLPYFPTSVVHSILATSRSVAAHLLHPFSRYNSVDTATHRDELNSEDPESEHFPASLEAHQLVRELVYDQPDQPSTARRHSSPGMEPGLQRRESEGGVLAQLLKLYGGMSMPTREARLHNGAFTEVGTPRFPVGQRTPGKDSTARKWRYQPFGHRMRLEDEIRVTVHIADIISRQRYIMQLCKALMKFGAPMHRLEEHMQKTATVLEVDSQYLYVPGCMIMSFDDPTTRTTEVKLVRVEQGIDLGLLEDTHDVYKNVIHDEIGVEEATAELEKILNSKPRFNKWIIVMVYGIASATVGPFAFNARPIDMPMIFLNGALLSILHQVIAPRSELYSNVFEVTASVLTSFIARGIGSITWDAPSGNREYLFCFSAIAQSSIALILPGYTVLSSSLELQSHRLVAGSIRMVYAFIYSLFLGYGITVGTTIYGLIDPNASSDVKCPNTGDWGNEYAPRFPFVAAFVLCLLVINQGRWKQAPVMLFIAESGYVVTYFVTQRIGSSSQVANTVGAFTIGVMGNLYSRLWHGHAATSILPGIFVLVPSGLAASGPLLSGIKSSDETRSNISTAINHSSYTEYSVEDSQIYTADLGFGMVQVSIGITVGLFIAALLIYPFGKRRGGLFSF